MLTSSRRSILYPNPATRADSADVPRDIAALVATSELDVVFSQGTHASRPAPGAGSPAAVGGGRLYWETDTLTLWYDTGTAWVNITPNTTIANGSITEIMLAAGSVGAPEIIDGSVGTAELAAGAVTTAKLAAALFPSQGAGAATEAFRALGTAAGQAAAGIHATQHGPQGADPLVAQGYRAQLQRVAITANSANVTGTEAAPTIIMQSGDFTLSAAQAVELEFQCYGSTTNDINQGFGLAYYRSTDGGTTWAEVSRFTQLGSGITPSPLDTVRDLPGAGTYRWAVGGYKTGSAAAIAVLAGAGGVGGYPPAVFKVYRAP